jgi:hypothetical protein
LAPYRVTYLQRWRLPEARVPGCNNPKAIGEPAAPTAPSKDAPAPNPAPKLVAPTPAPAEAPEKP